MESTLIVKTLALLEATAGHSDGRSLADLAAEVGLTKPTAHRILKTLVALGYMERGAGNGVYRQTGSARRLTGTSDDRRLVRAAEKPLKALHEQTGETVNLGVLRNGRVVYLTVLESPQMLRRTVNPSMTDPFACTALGRAIAAHLPAERQAYLLKHTVVERRTPHTTVEPAELAARLADAATAGYAVEENETDLGVMCVGAPVFDARGVAGAVSVSAPTVRVTAATRARLVAGVRTATDAISQTLRRIQE